MRKSAVLLLGLLAGGSTLLTTGCYYDRPNPWNTESDVADFQYKTEHDWLLEMRETWHPPQNHAPTLILPDLEAWRDTVLVNADAQTLTRMRDQSVQKVAGLEARAYSMAPVNEDNKVQIYELLWKARNEKIRLRMIDERLSAVR